MNVVRRYPARLSLALAAAALVLVIGAATAFGQDVAPFDPASANASGGATVSSGVSVSGTAVASSPDLGVSTAIGAPAWCCETSSGVPGLTVYGQANVDGQDAAARDAAIAAAVKDATAQANAAADAAGIQLGPIIDMQVSAMPVFYPMAEGVPTATSAPGSSTGSSAGGGTEPVPDPAPYFGSVSVTITWSIG